MTLRDATEQYIAWKQARGERCRNLECIMRRYTRRIGEMVGADEVSRDQASAFLSEAPSATNRAVRHAAVAGFYRYAIGRNVATRSPLPAEVPKLPTSAPAYIYTRDELSRLLATISTVCKTGDHLEPHTLRAFLLLLCGSGLRRGEAVRLAVSDVDLENALLTIRQSKFGKNRFVPLGSQLVQVLRKYERTRLHCLPDAKDPDFFTRPDGRPLNPDTVSRTFARLRCAAGIRRQDGAHHQPRLHDLRAIFAVWRLTTWYRQGADVQRLLPSLSTYLGHSSVAATQVYLRLTPELLEEAAERFECFATRGHGGRHD